MSDGERFLAAIRERAERRSRVSIEVVWCAFRAVVRGYTGDAEARAALAALIDDLARCGQLDVPKTAALWDTTATPPLPLWIALARPSAAAPALDHRTVAWPPELAFVTTLAHVPQIDELFAIKRFLAEGGRSHPLVPLRERSVALFGDEKRLDGLIKSRLFAPDRLSLELLRCYEVAPPLVYEPALAEGGDGVLIIENLHSYESFRRWNLTSGRYRAIAYGHGSELRATIRDLPRLCDRLGETRTFYFGDLDAAGILIAFDAARELARTGVSLELAPAVDWYAALLDIGEMRRLPGDGAQPPHEALAWFPEPLRQRVAALLSRGLRVPQELVGTEFLAVS